MTPDPLEVSSITEGRDFEAKLAGGRDGRGELPQDIFETYSAFANTEGGVILLGLREKKDHSFEVAGIADTAKVKKALWDQLNNRKTVSTNLLAEVDVAEIELDGCRVIRVRVPRATRKQQPVFIGENPLKGTFRRRHEGDYRVPEEIVRRMLAEQQEDPRDGRLLPKFDLSDIDMSTLASYRRRYQTRSPEHPFNQLDDTGFLRSIGGWLKDRQTGDEGLTAAGLLMFGRLLSIKEEFPNYMLDFQERAEPRTEARWVDRFTTDGSWSGNLFDFYQTVIVRLFRELRVPFLLDGDTRVEETAVHQALREALVNSLIHADYSGRVSLLVVKRPDLFGFRNSGTMRMPVELALKGGLSDCRNRRLQDMFRYVGLGEQAGSGLPKIQSAWRSQHWRAPELVEKVEPYEQTVFTLRMASLLPTETVAELERRFGESFHRATEVQKLALVTAAIEGSVTHARLTNMTDAHSRDVTLGLASLVQKGMLESSGEHKRTVYCLPGSPPVEEAFGFEPAADDTREIRGSTGAASSEHSAPSSEHSAPSSEHNAPSSEHNRAELERLAKPLRESGRAAPALVIEVIRQLCEGRYLSLQELAELTNRTTDTLRVHYLSKLVQDGMLRLRYPDQPTHPDQAYTSST